MLASLRGTNQGLNPGPLKNALRATGGGHPNAPPRQPHVARRSGAGGPVFFVGTVAPGLQNMTAGLGIVDRRAGLVGSARRLP